MRGTATVLLVATIVIFMPSPATAAPGGAVDRAVEIDHLLKSGRHMKAAGQVLVGLGCVDAIVATIVGPVGYWAGTVEPGDTTPAMAPRGSDTTVMEGAAIGLAVSAAVLIAVGVPLMAEGDGRLARVRRLVGVRSLRLAVVPGGGAALAW